MGNSASKDQSCDVHLNHFELMHVIGKGAFGKVRVVKAKTSKSLFALKYIDKRQCIQMHAIQNIFRERAILEDLNHPFIVNLNYAFQDNVNLYFVLDLKTGGDLRLHLNQHMVFPESAVKLWALELASAIQYLHTQNIVHRDIKPDNGSITSVSRLTQRIISNNDCMRLTKSVLLDSEGHAHLTDFNIAVNIDKSSILKSHSGTLPYLAPEVFEEHGYYWQVDWWSFGVTLYELVYSKRPFRAKRTSSLIKSIREKEIDFPHASSMPASANCVSFLRQLLDRNPFTRLGCRARQILDVRDHPWLRDMDWRLVEQKGMQSTFVPNPSINYLDPRVVLEEFLQDGLLMDPTTPKSKRIKSTVLNRKDKKEALPPPPEKQGKPQRPSATTSSKSGNSLLAYISRNSSNGQKRTTSASDAADIAGNIHAMMKQYKSDHKIAGIHIFGLVENEDLAEADREDLELRFMADNFLTYDLAKNPKRSKVAAAAASNIDAYPMPTMPSKSSQLPIALGHGDLSANMVLLIPASTASDSILQSDFKTFNTVSRSKHSRFGVMQLDTSMIQSQIETRNQRASFDSSSDSDSEGENVQTDVSLSQYLRRSPPTPSLNLASPVSRRGFTVRTIVPLPDSE
ncbi:kinase-like domain-containing protein [Chytriomyces cf. hyalinus JEL632]|nr:kinase-like domain-containing protein [Chytriomyces cf. hyalinus JEL632]